MNFVGTVDSYMGGCEGMGWQIAVWTIFIVGIIIFAAIVVEFVKIASGSKEKYTSQYAYTGFNLNSNKRFGDKKKEKFVKGGKEITNDDLSKTLLGL